MRGPIGICLILSPVRIDATSIKVAVQGRGGSVTTVSTLGRQVYNSKSTVPRYDLKFGKVGPDSARCFFVFDLGLPHVANQANREEGESVSWLPGDPEFSRTLKIALPHLGALSGAVPVGQAIET